MEGWRRTQRRSGTRESLVSETDRAVHVGASPFPLANTSSMLAGFFDFYIIPLTPKLKECGVFGVSSGEYLQYAIKNREEWEVQGEQVVAGMVEKCRKKYGVKGPHGPAIQVEECAPVAPSLGRLPQVEV